MYRDTYTTDYDTTTTHCAYLVLLLSSQKFRQLGTSAVVPDKKWIF